MEKSLMVIAIIIVFLTGFGSAIRVELQASNNWVIDLSSIKSSPTSTSTSFFLYNFPNSRVVIYTPIESDLAMSPMCPAPLAAVNSTSKTFISLNKSAGCNVNVLVRVVALDQLSEDPRTVKEKDGLIVWKVQGNRAAFQLLTPTQAKNVISLRLTKPEDDDCIIDLMMNVHHDRFYPLLKLRAFRLLLHLTVILGFLLLLLVKNCSVWVFTQLYQHEFPDHGEPEHHRLENNNHAARQE